MHFKAGNEVFSYTFKRVTKPGFMALYKDYEEEEEDDGESEDSFANKAPAFDFTKVATFSGISTIGRNLAN